VADVPEHLGKVGMEGRVDLRGAGIPQSECDLAGCDEVIEMGKASGWQWPMLSVAIDERRTELPIVVAAPQLPKRDGDVVEPVSESAVVEIDDPDIAAPEQRVIQVQISVNEAGLVGAVAELRHHPLHVGGTRSNLCRRSPGIRSQTSAAPP